MTTNQRPVRKWSTREECSLLEQVKENLSNEEIAKLHERSEGAIAIRLRKIAMEMKKDGKDIEHITKVTRVTEEELNEQKKYESKKTDSDSKKLAIIKRELERLLALL